MGNLTIISDKKIWDKAQIKLIAPSVLSSFTMVSAGAMLFPGENVKAEAVLYEEEGDCIFYPYLKRPCPYSNDLFDICSAYEFGGFWFSSDNKEVCKNLVNGFEKSFREYALKENIVCEILRINPFCKIEDLGWKDYELKRAGQHVIIPLKSGLNTVWKEFRGQRRTQVRQGQKDGLRFEFSEDTKTFTEIYHKRLDTLNSYKFYYFQEEYIKRLKDKKIIFIYDRKEELCCSQIYIIDNSNLFYFLSADIENKRKIKPSVFAIYKMVEWACANSIEYIHLGGGVDSLQFFKSLFSPHKIDYYLVKRIINQGAYDDLVKQHTKANGELENKGYFPLYRLDTKVPTKLPEERRYTATETLT
jgi:hypothetical protein